MNRLTKAWKALCGTLEPEVREVEVVREVERIKEVVTPVGDRAVTVFVARSRSFKEALTRYESEHREWWRRKFDFETFTPSQYATRIPKPPGPEPAQPEPPDWHGRAYLTCTQAFEAHGEDADLRPSAALIDNGKAYLFAGFHEAELAPKPKRPKGKATA